MPLPVATLDKAKTLFAGRQIIEITLPGAQAPLAFAAKELDDDPETDVKPLDFPGVDGKLREVRSVTSKEKEKFTYGLYAIKDLPTIFGGKMTGRISGCTAKIYLPDPDDALGKCAMVSAAFACTVSRDGKISHGNQEFSKSTIKIESNEDEAIDWDTDVDV